MPLDRDDLDWAVGAQTVHRSARYQVIEPSGHNGTVTATCAGTAAIGRTAPGRGARHPELETSRHRRNELPGEQRGFPN
jgi:hypothetical protein